MGGTVHCARTHFSSCMTVRPRTGKVTAALAVAFMNAANVALTRIKSDQVCRFQGKRVLFRARSRSLIGSLIGLKGVARRRITRRPRQGIVVQTVRKASHPARTSIMLLSSVGTNSFLFVYSSNMLRHLGGSRLSSVFGRLNNPRRVGGTVVSTYDKGARSGFSFCVVPVRGILSSMKVGRGVLSFLCSFVWVAWF